MSLNCQEFEYTNLILILIFLASFFFFQLLNNKKSLNFQEKQKLKEKSISFIENKNEEDLNFFLQN